MPLKHKNSDEANKHTPKGFDNASNFSRLLRDEIGQSRYTKEFVFPKAIDFVDGSAPPPTSDLNDIYVLIDTGGGSVHASWGSVSYNDWARQNGTTWGAVTPTAGDVCFDSTAGIYKVFGTSWGQLVPDAPNIYDIDGTIGSGREATITDTLTFLGGNLIKKGSDTLGTTSGFKLIDSASADLWDFRNNGDIYMGKNSDFYLDSNILNFDLGTTASPTQVGLSLDASNINYTGVSSLPIIEATNNNGQTFNVTASGYVQVISDLTNTIARFYNRALTQGFQILTNEAKLSSNLFTFKKTFSGSEYLVIQQDSGYSQLYMGNSSGFDHWLRTGSSAQATFFKNGIGSGKVLFGGSATLVGEKISLQDDTLIGASGDKVGFMGATPIVRVTTGVSSGAFVANTSGISDDTATFGGYTIGQIAQALINYGLLT